MVQGTQRTTVGHPALAHLMKAQSILGTEKWELCLYGVWKKKALEPVPRCKSQLWHFLPEFRSCYRYIPASLCLFIYNMEVTILTPLY